MDGHFMDDPGASSSNYLLNDNYEEELPCTNISELIAFNEAYKEVLDNAVVQIEEKLKENKEKQKLIQAELRSVNTVDISKKKIPVSLYLPPYFKDENGMCPPLSSEARDKLNKKWFDPLMKEEKKWTPADLKTLRDGIREALIVIMLQPLCSKRDILTSKLRNSNATTTQAERTQWTMELEEIMRKIDYIRNKKESEILTASADYSAVPWNEIANFNFKGTRTEWAVRAKWMNEMSPKWNHEPWTITEVEKLKEIRESPRFISWPMLATSLGTKRTAFQCLQKYKTEISQQSKEWTQEEDQKLIALTKLMNQNGVIQWEKIAQFMPGRTRQQVRTRFTHTLDTAVKHGRWTDQEDLLLICSVSRIGAKDWSKVAQAVPGRNDAQCRERWCNVLNRPANVTDRFTLIEDEQLLYAVKLFGKGSWTKCSTLLPRKTAKQLRRRYIQLIAAKLKMVAGFCSAVEAMECGRREEINPEEFKPITEIEMVANEKLNRAFSKYSELVGCKDKSAEEMLKRLNSDREVMAGRYAKYKNSANWGLIEQNLKEIVEKHRAGQSTEIRSNEVLKLLNITDIDVRYMIEKSQNLGRYYRARQIYTNVDKPGCRVRPIKAPIDVNIDTQFDKNTSENEKQMSLIEALCVVVRRHDALYWGKDFWRNYHIATAKNVKIYVKNMLTEKANEVAESRERFEKPPPKSTLAPTLPALQMMEMLKRAKKGLNQLASKHFYPINAGLKEQECFSEKSREEIDENTKLNIRLSKEITDSKQYNHFYAQMRTLFLEPFRLKLSNETYQEEQARLEKDMMFQQRSIEEDGIEEGTIQRNQSECSDEPTPESISRILNEGIQINTDGVLPENDQYLEKKKRINEAVEMVVENSLSTEKKMRSDHDSFDDDVLIEEVTNNRENLNYQEPSTSNKY